MFLGIFPFPLGCPICWHILLIAASYDPLYFWGLGCNVSSLTYNFIYLSFLFFFSSAHFSHSVMSDSLRPHGQASASLSITNSQSLLKLMFIEPVMPSNHLIPFSSCLQSFPTSGSFQMSQFFVSGGQSIGVFSFSISPSNEYSGMISFRMDWLDLLAVQGTLKSLLQHRSSKASILRH